MATTANSISAFEIDRRTAIRGLAAGVAAGFVLSEHDPILDAVQAFRDGLADYSANAPVDDHLTGAYAQATYIPPMQTLQAWDQPIKTKQGALAALETAMDEAEQHDNGPVEAAMMRAVREFLKA